MTEPTDTSPIVGITCDIAEGRARVRTTYADCVTRAGGTPILLPPLPALAHAHADLCHALILTGGDDPLTEPFGSPTHPKANRVNPKRQAYELAILDAFDHQPHKPVLGICLGMQYMALANGGSLDQHLPETTPTHADHLADRPHPITPSTESANPATRLTTGEVMSNHHQAISDPGALTIAARAHDQIIEAITDPSRPFYLGVQWHPERTDDTGLGQELFNRLIAATSASLAPSEVRGPG